MVYLNKFPWFFTMNQTMIIILSYKNQKIIQKPEFSCLGENTEKYKTFSVPITKEVSRIGKNREKLQKRYPIDYSLLIGQDLRQANNQTLFIILLKEFIKLNVNMDMKIENVKCVELNSKFMSAVWNTQTLKGNLLE